MPLPTGSLRLTPHGRGQSQRRSSESGESEFDPDIRGERQARRPDLLIAEVAGRQHGVVARAQLSALGLGRRAIDYRLEIGRLHLLYRGVYAVGHRVLSFEGRWMAAVLAGGDRAALSHRSAAALWGIRPSASARVEITVPSSRRSKRGIEQHSSVIARDEMTTVRGIRVTTVARTLVDLAAVLDAHQLKRAAHEAEVRRLWDALSIQALTDRHRGRRGVVAVKALLADDRLGTYVLRSELEGRFLALIENSGLPAPQANVPVRAGRHRFEVDFVWASAHVIAELDGHAAHATRATYERDRERDRILQAAGWRVVRVTWRQLHDAPDAVSADLRVLLAA